MSTKKIFFYKITIKNGYKNRTEQTKPHNFIDCNEENIDREKRMLVKNKRNKNTENFAKWQLF